MPNKYLTISAAADLIFSSAINAKAIRFDYSLDTGVDSDTRVANKINALSLKLNIAVNLVRSTSFRLFIFKRKDNLVPSTLG